MKQNEQQEHGIIDTSTMNEGQRAALEMAEDSRDTRAVSGFAASLFMGVPKFSPMLAHCVQSHDDAELGNDFIGRLECYLNDEVDPDAIDREGEIPDEVFAQLAEMGCFGIKIPQKYGGLGLSQTNYSRTAMLLGSHCGNLAALLSAHQSIGVPQPLLVFGTEAQKEKYLPHCAAGGVSAFALTESGVGSDPAGMLTTAELSEDGSHFLLNGEKVWCTNLLKSRYIIVMAKTPSEAKPHATTAFLVDVEADGVEIVTRCHFMGLKALYNGVVRFHDVKVPLDDVVYKVGKGLKVALTTLNTGRLTLPAACIGLMRRAQEITLRWSHERVQWGQQIGRHAAIASKLADISADLLATESMVYYVSSLVDENKKADIRIEAAMAKLWGTEAAWSDIDMAMQIRGGRGYETADSLRARGESADPIERMFRDCRINTIFEGSSEIMKLFIAREALDPHLRRGAKAIDTRLGIADRLSAAAKAGLHYAQWYPARWLPRGADVPESMSALLAGHLKKINHLSRRLARALFHSMVIKGPKLERDQLRLGRLVDIATELFAMSCACMRTHALILSNDPQVDGKQLEQTCDYLCKRGYHRINEYFTAISQAPDVEGYRLVKRMMGNL
ncbi:acyl-CoA dehydrogenase family protein [Persicirhabdus sediminis]|uniref:Acyl-CoA dehydrogenase family protein n=1 Tax=Persicirhabdus sediminis TaxID=454144 RepID=A0A8J7SGS2_9BACT|nr:acyl-CoA dehydrogenase family protein [Persicirhabdus sediminis]MBK1790305.1 acyl-CoA dehydrogenase family protein [Persicirhabdus sediminis]